MIQVRFDAPKGATFPDDQARATRAACRQVAMLARLSVQFAATNLIEWFGTATDPILRDNITRMNRVLNDANRTITFVDARTFDLHVDYNPDNIFEAPKLHNQTPPKSEMSSVLSQIQMRGAQPPSATKSPIKKILPLGGIRPAPGPQAGQFYGYAFPIDNRDVPGDTHTHQGSGFRVFLGAAYFATPPGSMERAQTIYHEMTHKVLGTNDHFYGPALCRAAARSKDNRALFNADSYGFYVTNLSGYLW